MKAVIIPPKKEKLCVSLSERKRCDFRYAKSGYNLCKCYTARVCREKLEQEK